MRERKRTPGDVWAESLNTPQRNYVNHCIFFVIKPLTLPEGCVIIGIGDDMWVKKAEIRRKQAI